MINFPEVRKNLVARLKKDGSQTFFWAPKAGLYYSKKRGIHIRANTPIKKDEVILKENPFFYQVSAEFSNKYCYLCLIKAPAQQPDDHIYFCERCLADDANIDVVADCMLYFHEFGYEATTQILMERALHRFQTDPDGFGQLKPLVLAMVVTHPAQEYSCLELPEEKVKEVFEFTGMTPLEVIKVDNIVRHNSYALYDGSGVIIGKSFYPVLGFADHSCCPNGTIVTGDGCQGTVVVRATPDIAAGEVVVRATQDIAAGEVITMNYLGITDGLDVCTRRKMFQQRYGALCHCDACISCLRCHTLTPGNKTCSKCSNALYCSKLCQVSHWHQHKTECNEVAAYSSS